MICTIVNLLMTVLKKFSNSFLFRIKPLYYLIAFFFLLVLSFSLIFENYNQQFLYLAQAFLQGKLYFLEKPGTLLDIIYYKGQYYWHLGPFPAILLLPFVLVGDLFKVSLSYQAYLQVLLVLGTFFLGFSVAKHFGYSKDDALWLAFAFCFSSVYHFTPFIPFSW